MTWMYFRNSLPVVSQNHHLLLTHVFHRPRYAADAVTGLAPAANGIQSVRNAVWSLISTVDRIEALAQPAWRGRCRSKTHRPEKRRAGSSRFDRRVEFLKS